ncbi:uncharacterized protein KY384_004005 [Bacidia gigantensis]|uniref:uncharacterized protein n=1 Tax=Bacidia gigantensis TaxID=2732470 RepID=UPI001D039D5A|nr:uncharacterized protein KY384_004005 [Bacidia gigantensis]KAG8530650.1 hypothetical protein KY384_004005 [Bacidia gigantensis]
MSRTIESLTSTSLKEWDALLEIIDKPSRPIEVNGTKLNLAEIVAVARHGINVKTDRNASNRLAAGAQCLADDLQEGKVIYAQRRILGVNTGFGGSANTRTEHVKDLQISLVSMLQCGITYPSRQDFKHPVVNDVAPLKSKAVDLLRKGLPLEDSVSTNCMPEPWVRAAILVRINSLMHGASSARPVIVARMIDLLRHDIIPRVPMHGSISASGDLSPLSYIAGCIQGSPNISVLAGEERRITTADVAMAEANIAPVSLAAKEGLAIVNGTAFSSGVAALLMHDVCNLGGLCQVLAAMSVEALGGTSESFHPFFAEVRPHPGQVESSQNIYDFLQSSKLSSSNDGSEKGSLRQDRYSIRTASQWIGPALEDCALAYHQVVTESNSVTDNPLTDPSDPSGDILHGGNFQAKVVTSAMEKARQSLQSLGRMLFTQCTEVTNPATNNGLPPNLTVDPPSESFLMKAADIMSAALLSELGFLANPVGSHVQTAEMGNQALNSIALISARYTHIAADILSKLCAVHLLLTCQALDLRAMNQQFLCSLEGPFRSLTFETFEGVFSVAKSLESIWSALIQALVNSIAEDAPGRFQSVASTLQSTVLDQVDPTSSVPILPLLKSWTDSLTALLTETHKATLKSYLKRGSAAPLLGHAACRIYSFVRQELKVPFLHEGILHVNGPGSADNLLPTDYKSGVTTIGAQITVLHEAIRQGVLYLPVAEAMREARENVAARKSIKPTPAKPTKRSRSVGCDVESEENAGKRMRPVGLSELNHVTIAA